MERFKVHQIELPDSGHDSYIQVLNSIFMGMKGYETTGDEENCILRTRERFKSAIKKYKAPETRPTVFRNHSERGTWLDSDFRKRKLDPQNPPEEPLAIFTFADDIYANIVINFSKDYPEGKQKPYLLHDKPANIVCLSQEYSPEEAMEEALLLNPFIYADDVQIVKQSVYVDPDTSKWRFQEGCMAKYSRIEDNEIQFIVDVSVIYPENIWSTAYVTCYDCGKVAETKLCNAVTDAARREIWYNISQTYLQKEVSERERCVIRLPMTNSLHSFCSFREGLIGITPLTRSGSLKPSLYVRVRIMLYTNEASRIGPVLHNHKWS